MEALTVTLDTAKKLKAAGFPQYKISFYWAEVSGFPGMSLAYYEFCRSSAARPLYAAPTSQELADQLPMGEHSLKLSRPADSRWVAYCDTATGPYETADTMSEALAYLWLRFNQETN